MHICGATAQESANSEESAAMAAENCWKNCEKVARQRSVCVALRIGALQPAVDGAAVYAEDCCGAGN